jgi:hypothetical protein
MSDEEALQTLEFKVFDECQTVILFGSLVYLLLLADFLQMAEPRAKYSSQRCEMVCGINEARHSSFICLFEQYLRPICIKT